MSLPIIFGNLSDRTEVSLPYFGILYRPGWLKSKNFYLEFELGYFKLQSNFLTTENPNVIPSPLILEESESHNFPLTLSIGYHLDLNDWFALNPKLGLGYMFTYNKTKLRGDKFTSFLVLKPALEMTFKLGKNSFLFFDGSLLIAQNTKSTLFRDLTYYLIPSIGVRHRFTSSPPDTTPYVKDQYVRGNLWDRLSFG